MIKKRRKLTSAIAIVIGFVILAVFIFFLWQAVKNPKLEFSNTKLEQGDTLIINLNWIWGAPKEARLGLKPVLFFRWRWGYAAIAGIDVNARPGKISFYAKLPSGKELNRELVVLPRSFRITKLIVPPKLAARGIDAPNLVKSVLSNDMAAINSVFKIFTMKAGFQKPFERPLPKWIDVGNFGVLRQYPGGGARHLGVDLKAKAGDPVYSINAGTVRFAGKLTNFGNTVLIDHGLGIFSGYLHLSEIKVNADSDVEKSEVIGLVGSTGDYSLAPHLHFTLKIGGASVDPKRFLDVADNFLK